MNQKIIKVELLEIDKNTDVMRFYFEDAPLDVNLNSSTCQNELKKVFIRLLNELILQEKISLKFSCDTNYKREMYREVCEEYIKDLNRELQNTKRKFNTEFKD